MRARPVNSTEGVVVKELEKVVKTLEAKLEKVAERRDAVAREIETTRTQITEIESGLTLLKKMANTNG